MKEVNEIKEVKETEKEVEHAKSKTATFQAADEHETGARSPVLAGHGQVPELP
jgi:hypothetical protein